MTTHQMRVADRKLSEGEAHEILEAGEYCVISTVDEDGMPYGVPLSYVMMDGRLYIHTTNTYGHKLDDFERDDRVCVTVATEVEACFENDFLTSRYASVIARGRICRVEDDLSVRQALVALTMKYLPEYKHEIGPNMKRDLPETAIWAIDLDEITGKGAHRLKK